RCGATRGQDEDDDGRECEDGAGHGSSSGSTEASHWGTLTSTPRAWTIERVRALAAGHTILHRPSDDKNRSGRESGAPCQIWTPRRRGSSSRLPHRRTPTTPTSSADATIATPT